MTHGCAARVRVPATSANLGAGFDCVGMAVDRWLTASVATSGEFPALPRTGPAAITVRRSGTLASLTVAPSEDAVVQGFLAACESRRRIVPARLDFVVGSEIPVARGLGSSSAALVAGVRLANVALDLGMSLHEIAVLATQLEGHPDNVAPAALGGLVLALRDDAPPRRWVFAPVPVHEDLAFVFIVPPFLIETARARAVLPADVAHVVAVSAAGRGAALVHGLASGDGALLRIALDDVLHVPYRQALVPGLSSVRDAACAAGAFGLTLSGSGSTLVAIASQDSAREVAAAMERAWRGHGVVGETFVQRRPATGATTDE